MMRGRLLAAPIVPSESIYRIRIWAHSSDRMEIMRKSNQVPGR